MMDALGIARSGLDATMLRLTASASNIANANAAGPVPGSVQGDGTMRAYRPLRAETTPLPGGAVSARLVQRDPGYRLTYDPASRDADAKGMVAAPDVDVADELVDTLSAKLAAEANLKVITTASDIEQRTLQLWG